MFQACRPVGRLFYWMLAIVTVAALGTQVSARERTGKKIETAGSPTAKPDAPGLPLRAASPSPQSGPTLTSVTEVRRHDYGWGTANDRNLVGRFGTREFSLPRLARMQNYFLRLYDSSSPPRYSRYSAALHIDIPL